MLTLEYRLSSRLLPEIRRRLFDALGPWSSAIRRDFLRQYSRLTAAMIRLAPMYAQAYPPRGRPRKQQPWRDRAPLRSVRTRLS